MDSIPPVCLYVETNLPEISIKVPSWCHTADRPVANLYVHVNRLGKTNNGNTVLCVAKLDLNVELLERPYVEVTT